jgi:hypothetical protein
MFTLEPCDGPDCPECGCNETVVLSKRRRTAQRIDPIDKSMEDMEAVEKTLECQHCYHTWRICSLWTAVAQTQKSQNKSRSC